MIIGEIHSISSITTSEYIQTIASWEYFTNKKQYNCKENLRKMTDKNRIEQFKNRNGCEAKSKTPRQTHDYIEFYNCYCNHLSSSFDTYLFIHDQYTKGFLPFKGTVLEQPNKSMEVINLISKLKSDYELKLQKQANK